MPTDINHNVVHNVVHYHYTIAVIGMGGVGKTTYITRLKTGEFTPNYIHTIYSNYSKNLTFYTSVGTVGVSIIENNTVPTDEADAYILMFDLIQTNGWNSTTKVLLNNWYTTIRQNYGNVPIILCGNKCDLLGTYTIVSNSKIQQVKKDMIYYQVSAKSNYNFEKPFLTIFRNLITPSLQLTEAPPVTLPEVVFDLSVM